MSLLLRAVLIAPLLLWLATSAFAHALQPGFLDIAAQELGVWRVTWRVPDLNGAPMPIRPILPESCDQREPGELRFDGVAHVSAWRAVCTGGLAGGTVGIAGLENTHTDVLVRFEFVPGKSETLRLTAQQPSARLPTIPTRADVFASYVAIGICHILEGADHLLFVLCLILLIPSTRQLIGVITAFTLAHSLSLAAATLGWVVAPGPPVEAVIALSIMFLAAELANQPEKGSSLIARRPWIAAFGFGLLHGLGFARALDEIGLPDGEIPLALFSFNLGVEIGQLMFVAAILSGVALLRRLFPGLMVALTMRGPLRLRGLAYGIGTISAFWFLSRVAAF